jgi:hypothetical protein
MRLSAVLVDGAWLEKVRRDGEVVRVSEGFDSLGAAKDAVERRLAEMPEIVSAAMPHQMTG